MTKVVVVGIVIIVIFLLLRRSDESKRIALENRQIGVDFMAENKLDQAVKVTDSGLQYLVLQSGDGELNPTAKNKVTVHYHGTLLNGEVFDSSVLRNETISFGLNQVIKGWTEGVQLMVVGDKYRFFIPSELAYGERSAGKIPPGSTLIFEVELFAIN